MNAARTTSIHRLVLHTPVPKYSACRPTGSCYHLRDGGLKMQTCTACPACVSSLHSINGQLVVPVYQAAFFISRCR